MQNFPCSENIEIDRMNISVKKELEGSDDEDDLNGKKVKSVILIVILRIETTIANGLK